MGGWGWTVVIGWEGGGGNRVGGWGWTVVIGWEGGGGRW